MTEKQLLKKYKLKEMTVIIKRQELQPTVKSRQVVREAVKPRRKYTCYTCWQKFDYKHEVNRHRIMHEEEEKTKAPAKIATPKKQAQTGTAPKKPAEASTAPKKADKPVAAQVDPPSYHCESCEVSFGTIDEMKKHPKNNCRFKCGVCSRTYNTVHGFTVHILQHKINSAKSKCNSQYDCTECSATFSDIIQLRSHTIVAHKFTIRKEPVEEEGSDFTCEQCFDVFMSKKELDEHMEFHVELQTSDMPENAFGDNDGAIIASDEENEAKMSISEPDLDENVELQTNDVPEAKVPITQSDLDSLNTSITIPKEEFLSDDEAGTSAPVGSRTCRVLKPTKNIPRVHFNCMKCQRIYMDKPEFEQHLIGDECSQIKTCSACESEFGDNYKYYKHVKQIHETVLICKYCFGILPDSSSMDTHKLEHFKSFKNVCKICFRIMETYDEFCEHLKNHLNL